MAEWLDGPPESVSWETHVQTMDQVRDLRAKIRAEIDYRRELGDRNKSMIHHEFAHRLENILK